MTLDNLLSRLDAVRSQSRGWVARCPSHEDRSPSLAIAEGDKGILLRCWAGCSVEEITRALGIPVTALFFDDHDRANPQRVRHPAHHERHRPITWRQYAGALEDEAFGLWFRGETVLSTTKRLDVSTWSDEDVETALDGIDSAHVDLARAACLERLAFTIRLGGLKSFKTCILTR